MMHPNFTGRDEMRVIQIPHESQMLVALYQGAGSIALCFCMYPHQARTLAASLIDQANQAEDAMLAARGDA